MASETQTETHVVELATESFKAFCDDIAGMFGIGMECEQQEVRTETVTGLKKCFKKLVAVNVVESTGALEGTFQLIFDQEGLFTLGGVIVMLPEQRILTNRKDPSPQLASSMVDAVGEAGNLLVGSWDRVFREGLRKHGHFLQRLPAFIGKPWDDPQNKIGLSDAAEFIYVPYEMTIGTYPSFNCGVIFPKSLFGGPSEASNESGSEPSAETSGGPKAEEAAPQAQTPQDMQTNPETAGTEKAEPLSKSDKSQDDESKAAAVVSAPAEASQKVETTTEGKTGVEQPAATQEDSGKAPKSEDSAAAEKVSTSEKQVKENKADTPAKEAVEVQAEAAQTQAEPAAEPQSAGETPPAAQEAEPTPEHQEPATGKVSQAIRKMTESQAALPGESGPPPRLASGDAGAGKPAVSESETSASPCVTIKDKDGIRQVPERRRKNTGLSRCLSICAKDFMQDRIIWVSPDETVQQALAKMQQHDTGYIMVGTDGALEGIVSRSDITGALSPYLRSIFAKWRRPLDDATLKIKVKWIMSRPVRTISLQTPLVTIMDNMCRFGGGGLPVVDEQGKVQGLVTVFNVFQMMLNACADVTTVGRAPQTPPLT